jgi:hypothetical protein
VFGADGHAQRHKQAVRLVLVRKREHVVCSQVPVRRNAVEQRVDPIPQAWRDRE